MQEHESSKLGDLLSLGSGFSQCCTLLGLDVLTHQRTGAAAQCVVRLPSMHEAWVWPPTLHKPAWWHPPVVPGPERQSTRKFKVVPSHMMSSRPAWATGDPRLKTHTRAGEWAQYVNSKAFHRSLVV